MKAYAINGSPRKGGNTATLLDRSLEGLAAEGFETERIDLYGLDYKGCISCFACKRLGGKSFGRCALKDGLTEVIEKIVGADVLVFGSPVYLYNVASGYSAFFERFLFPHVTYEKGQYFRYPKRLVAGFIHTMGVPPEMFEQNGTSEHIQAYRRFLKDMTGEEPEVMYSFDAYQFSDYSKYSSSAFDLAKKEAHRRDIFPIDCQDAYEMGRRLAVKAKNG